jgi:serine/threonine protein kinase
MTLGDGPRDADDPSRAVDPSTPAAGSESVSSGSVDTNPTFGSQRTNDRRAQTPPPVEAVEVEWKNVSERFEQLEELGAGGMGRVLMAFDRKLRRTVAIKRIRSTLGQNPEHRARFLREAQMAAGLNHPSVVTVYDILEDEDGPYLVLEYVEGESLADRLRTGAIPWPEAVRLLQPICSALGLAHRRGIVHRDIKPANILLPEHGDPKLADFGIARSVELTELTATGAMLGTLDYMAPEQTEASRSVDQRADVYSLAATLYHMVTGESPRPIFADAIPVEIRAVVLGALKRSPEQRTASIELLAAQLLERVPQSRPPVDRPAVPLRVESHPPAVAAAEPSAPVSAVSPPSAPKAKKAVPTRPPTPEKVSPPLHLWEPRSGPFRPSLAHWLAAYAIVVLWSIGLSDTSSRDFDYEAQRLYFGTLSWIALWWAALTSLMLYRAQRLVPPQNSWRLAISVVTPFLSVTTTFLVNFLVNSGREWLPEAFSMGLLWFHRQSSLIESGIEALLWYGLSRRLERVRQQLSLKQSPRIFPGVFIGLVVVLASRWFFSLILSYHAYESFDIVLRVIAVALFSFGTTVVIRALSNLQSDVCAAQARNGQPRPSPQTGWALIIQRLRLAGRIGATALLWILAAFASLSMTQFVWVRYLKDSFTPVPAPKAATPIAVPASSLWDDRAAEPDIKDEATPRETDAAPETRPSEGPASEKPN